LLLDFDHKMRYQQKVRLMIYQKMINWIKKRGPKVFVYLCMEDKAIWRASGLAAQAGAVFSGKKSWLG